MRLRPALTCLLLTVLSVNLCYSQGQSGPTQAVTERQLLAWLAAGIPTFNLQSEVQARGVAFAPDAAWLETLKQAGVDPALLGALAKLPAAASAAPHDEIGPRLVGVIRDVHAKKYSVAAMHLASLAKANRSDADLLLALGWVMGQQDEWGEAMPAFVEAVRLAPESGFAHELLAYGAYRITDSNLALKEAKTAVEMRPSDPDAYKFLGLAYSQIRNYPKASAAYDRALQLKPDYGMVYYDIGLELQDQGQLRESAEAYQKAISLDTRIGTSTRIWGMYWLTCNAGMRRSRLRAGRRTSHPMS